MATKQLKVVPTVNDLTGLWILAHGIIVIDLMLGDLITFSRCSPMPIQSLLDVIHFHHGPPI